MLYFRPEESKVCYISYNVPYKEGPKGLRGLII